MEIGIGPALNALPAMVWAVNSVNRHWRESKGLRDEKARGWGWADVLYSHDYRRGSRAAAGAAQGATFTFLVPGYVGDRASFLKKGLPHAPDAANAQTPAGP